MPARHRSRIPAAPLLAVLLAAAVPLCEGVAAGARLSGGTRAPAAHAGRATSSGIATWYGPGLYGHMTACGQALTPLTVGVANRTLPCGTLVRISYAGHSLVVPVIDRGPYGPLGASWDLTAGTAQRLGVTETVRVEATVVGATANVPQLGAPPAVVGESLYGGAAAS